MKISVTALRYVKRGIKIVRINRLHVRDISTLSEHDVRSGKDAEGSTARFVTSEYINVIKYIISCKGYRHCTVTENKRTLLRAVGRT